MARQDFGRPCDLILNNKVGIENSAFILKYVEADASGKVLILGSDRRK